MTILYLACPYSDPEVAVRQHRVAVATIAAACLMREGHVVFSPITHGHQVVEYLPLTLRHSFEFWMGQCLPVLEKSNILVILPVPGWRASKGLQEEIFTANMRGLRIAVLQQLGNVEFDTVSAEELKQKNWEILNVE